MQNDVVIIYEDENVAVVNKPAGLVVTPGPGYKEEETLVGWLIERFGPDLRKVGSGGHRPGIVHRLDKDTSGLMVVAKNQPAFLDLVAQFKRRRVSKEYLALVWGDAGDKKEVDQEFVIDAPIGRNPKNRMKFGVVKSGKQAKTKFRIIDRVELGQEIFTLLLCFPRTGRTHQIRVHLKSLGHSIVGDQLYQSRSEIKKYSALVASGLLLNHMYLHATRLTFKLSVINKIKTFEAPATDIFQPFLAVDKLA